MNLSKYNKVVRELNQLSSDAGYMQRVRHPSFYLERMRIFLEKLGNPEKQFQYIHIGGTAGKGSITIMLHHILHKAKKRVGSYMSPHVTTLAERFIINTRLVSPHDVVWAWQRLKPVINGIKRQKGSDFIPSYFEACFAISVLLFKKYKVGWVVLEVGCGGEFDATNAIPAPAIAILTNVHLDHMELLGRTRKRIAQTKAGIIKRGSRIITGENDPAIRAIFQKRAKQKGDPFIFVSKPKNNADILLYGNHQRHNAALAVKAAHLLRIPEYAIRKGLASARLPARFEIMQNTPLVIIDGAHNPAKLSALKKAVASLPYKKLHAILGMGGNKPTRQMLKIILPLCDTVVVTQARLRNPKPVSATRLYAEATKLTKKPVAQITPVHNAVQRTMRKAEPDDLILITGSLYCAGEARAFWISEQRILSTGNLFLS